MSHARQQIRDQIVSVLNAYPVSATVVPTRAWIVQPTELPMIGVYTSDEESSLDEGASMDSSGTLLRILNVVLDITVQGVDGQTGMIALDNLAEECETALGAARDILGIMDLLPATMETDQATEGETITSKMTLSFICMYRTAVGSPELIT